METQTKIENLRKAADYLEQHIKVIESMSVDALYVPGLDWKQQNGVTVTTDQYGRVTFECYGPGAASLMAALRRYLVGKWEKETTDYYFMLKQEQPSGLHVQIESNRDAVCTAKVVGKEAVTIPAVEASPARVEVKDVIEWECSPLLSE